MERERQEKFENLAKKYLYKGLDSKAFIRYFRQGGISAHHPQGHWLTEDWSWSYDFALEFRKYTQAFCLSLIDKSVLQRGRIKASSWTSMIDLGSGQVKLFDFRGKDTIRWSEVLKTFTTPNGLRAIKNAYDQVSPPELEWPEFTNSLVVLKEDFSDLDFEDNLYRALCSRGQDNSSFTI